MFMPVYTHSCMPVKTHVHVQARGQCQVSLKLHYSQSYFLWDLSLAYNIASQQLILRVHLSAPLQLGVTDVYTALSFCGFWGSKRESSSTFPAPSHSPLKRIHNRTTDIAVQASNPRPREADRRTSLRLLPSQWGSSSDKGRHQHQPQTSTCTTYVHTHVNPVWTWHPPPSVFTMEDDIEDTLPPKV